MCTGKLLVQRDRVPERVRGSDKVYEVVILLDNLSRMETQPRFFGRVSWLEHKP